jgi:hypothetical protein
MPSFTRRAAPLACFIFPFVPSPLFVIGRHHATYRPNISDKTLLSQIKFKPSDAAKVFVYPPDPNSNDFIRYRVSRLIDFEKDPAIAPTEKQRLQQTRTTLNQPSDLYPLIFHTEHNRDFSPPVGDGVERWYSHQFALSGGQSMQLPADYATAGMYNRPVTYLTFFQECVQEIG